MSNLSVLACLFMAHSQAQQVLALYIDSIPNSIGMVATKEVPTFTAYIPPAASTLASLFATMVVGLTITAYKVRSIGPQGRSALLPLDELTDCIMATGQPTFLINEKASSK